MSWFRRYRGVPPTLAAALGPEEHLLGLTSADGGIVMATTRFGLWVLQDDRPQRIDWHLISKARLADRVLELTVAEEIERWPDRTAVLLDGSEFQLRPERLTKLTDMVHARVRRSVAASRYLNWPDAGGWVVLRRVAGRDGLMVQVRVDPGADPHAEGFADAVAQVAEDIWPAGVERG